VGFHRAAGILHTDEFNIIEPEIEEKLQGHTAASGIGRAYLNYIFI
jgi:hypothetical protein